MKSPALEGSTVEGPDRRRARVLVTVGEQHYVMSACRALHEAGFLVTACASDRPALAHASRFHHSVASIPDAHAQPEEHVRAIRAIVTAEHDDVLIPGDEASLLAISQFRDLLQPSVRTGLPPHAAVTNWLDKIEQLRVAAQCAMAVPAGAVAESVSDAQNVAGEIGYPVVVKPSRSQVRRPDGIYHHRKSLFVTSDAELERAVMLVGPRFLVQRWIARSSVFSFCGVFADGALLSSSFARYRRTWPPHAGSASYAETLPMPQGISAQIVGFLRTIAHQGIFELEFIGPDANSLLFLDFNPRLYGSLVLAIRAGANLPAAWASWLAGLPVHATIAKPGYAYRWEEGELRNLLDFLRRGRMRDVVDVVRPRRRVVNALLRVDDPAPFVSRVAYTVGRRLYGRGHE